MFNFDANNGKKPTLGDKVVFLNTSSDLDGFTGRIGGWGDASKLLALVILDSSYKTNDGDYEVISIPVTCLDLRKSA